jgi:hypothetical protein
MDPVGVADPVYVIEWCEQLTRSRGVASICADERQQLTPVAGLDAGDGPALRAGQDALAGPNAVCRNLHGGRDPPIARNAVAE